MVRACASVKEKLKIFCSDKNFDILSLRLWCLNLSCLSRLEILDIWQPVPLQRKIEFVENLIRPRFLSICSQPSLQYPTETTIPNPNTPNMTQLRASYRGWQIRNTRFYLDSFDRARWEMPEECPIGMICDKCDGDICYILKRVRRK